MAAVGDPAGSGFRAPLGQLYGRDADVERAVAALDGPSRLVLIVGAAGVGKTRLALGVAGAVEGRFGRRLVAVPLAAVGTRELVLPTIARHLEIGEDGSMPLDRLRRRLGGADRSLLVLDNLEHLDGVAEVVRELLDACPALTILATSQVALGLAGEALVTLEPLPVPSADASPAEIRSAASVELLVARASAAGSILTDGDLPILAEICARLDGLPLAIELAAARLPLLGVATLRERLAHGLRELVRAGSGPDRHRSAADAVAWTYGLLGEDERALFRRLSVFTGGFTAESAVLIAAGSDATFPHAAGYDRLVDCRLDELALVLDLPPLGIDALATLARLMEAHLVRAATGADGLPRFEMPSVIRAFGVEALEAAGELAATRRAHAGVVLGFAEPAATELWTARTGSTRWRRLNDEIGNLRAALAVLTDPTTGDATLAHRLVASTWFFFQLQGLSGEARTWMERALALPGGRVWSRAFALTGLGFVAWMQGDDERADAAAREVVDAAEGQVGPALRASAHFDLALVAWRRGATEEMVTRLLTARGLYTSVGDANGEGFCALALGVIHRLGGQPAHARVLFDEAFRLHDGAGHAWGAATSRYFAGEAAHDTGEAAGAAALIVDGLERYWEQGDVWGSGACIAGLAVMAVERDELERAAKLFGAAFAMCERIGAFLPPTDLGTYKRVAAEVRGRIGAAPFVMGERLTPAEAVASARELAADIAAGRGSRRESDTLRQRLTVDQLEVVELLCDGLAVKEIAAHLSRSEKSIYQRLERARDRLGVTSQDQLIATAAALRERGRPNGQHGR